jgi:hypothetical protein
MSLPIQPKNTVEDRHRRARGRCGADIHRHPGARRLRGGATVRRNAFTMAASDPILVGYRRAITAMKGAGRLTTRGSWSYQAAIHGTLATPVLTAWNTCHIDSRYFCRGTACTCTGSSAS